MNCQDGGNQGSALNCADIQDIADDFRDEYRHIRKERNQIDHAADMIPSNLESVNSDLSSVSDSTCSSVHSSSSSEESETYNGDEEDDDDEKEDETERKSDSELNRKRSGGSANKTKSVDELAHSSRSRSLLNACESESDDDNDDDQENLVEEGNDDSSDDDDSKTDEDDDRSKSSVEDYSIYREDSVLERTIEFDSVKSDFSVQYGEPTQLYRAVEEHDWDSILTFFETDEWGWRCNVFCDSAYYANPEKGASIQARTWVGTTDENGEICRLPIHAAIDHKAPYPVIEKLVKLNRKGVKLPDSDGNYPLHIAFHVNSPLRVVTLLLKEYPAAISKRNIDKLLPDECGIENEVGLILKMCARETRAQVTKKMKKKQKKKKEKPTGLESVKTELTSKGKSTDRKQLVEVTAELMQLKKLVSDRERNAAKDNILFQKSQLKGAISELTKLKLDLEAHEESLLKQSLAHEKKRTEVVINELLETKRELECMKQNQRKMKEKTAEGSEEGKKHGNESKTEKISEAVQKSASRGTSDIPVTKNESADTICKKDEEKTNEMHEEMMRENNGNNLSDIYAKIAVAMDKKARSELACVLSTGSGILDNPEYRIDSMGSTEVVGVIQHNHTILSLAEERDDVEIDMEYEKKGREEGEENFENRTRTKNVNMKVDLTRIDHHDDSAEIVVKTAKLKKIKAGKIFSKMKMKFPRMLTPRSAAASSNM